LDISNQIIAAIKHCEAESAKTYAAQVAESN
jgi:hypothetical protein